MDRVIAYPGQVPAVEDFLQAQKNQVLGLGRLIDAVMGPASVVAAGFAASIDGAANLSIGPGSLTASQSVDPMAFGVLGVDGTVVSKQGITTTTTVLAMGGSLPGTAGQAINLLVQASLADADAGAVVLGYYNTNAPTTPYNGPAGSGTSQPTRRLTVPGFTVVAGVPATAGGQATPVATPGAVPLYVVTLAYGAAPVVAQHPQAPFLPFTLPQLRPGFSRRRYFTSSTVWTVPSGVQLLGVRGLWGAGGGGGGASGAASVGSGGGGGGYAEGVLAVTPGMQVVLTVGGAGTGGTPGTDGTAGGNTSFGTLLSAAGGGAGRAGTAAIATAAGAGGSASVAGAVTGRTRPGGGGATGFQAGSSYVSGPGGDTHESGPSGIATSNSTTPQAGASGVGSGQGGGGGVAGGNGGAGGPGLIVIEF